MQLAVHGPFATQTTTNLLQRMEPCTRIKYADQTKNVLQISMNHKRLPTHCRGCANHFQTVRQGRLLRWLLPPHQIVCAQAVTAIHHGRTQQTSWHACKHPLAVLEKRLILEIVEAEKQIWNAKAANSATSNAL